MACSGVEVVGRASLSPSTPSRAERVERLLRIDRVGLALALGDPDQRSAAAVRAAGVGCDERDAIDATVAAAAALGAQLDLRRAGAELGIGAGVAVAEAVDRLVLGHADDAGGHGVAVGVGGAGER